MKIADEKRIEIVEDKTLWKGWSHLRKLVFDYRKQDGETARLSWEVFDRGHAVAVLLYHAGRGTTLLVRQFRMPAHIMGDTPFLLEVPAGMTDGEETEKAARREVLEETGYAVKTLKFLFSSYMSPGAVTEKLHFYAAEVTDAEKVAAGGGLAEENEDLELVELPLSQAIAMIDSGEIVDAKTIMLLQWAALHL
ncbi:NUDIX domain-containing protein [Rhizobium paknamense]|uniref:GDP-mannose pyrophosphatase n=1 Tax=Rhizobium paknamense TaxID=1206817 RepID=A0ABU0I7B6_9HYPH|nr:NUDIX domain-containing protein [Rhizobium paknamense]MDQ0454113.1 nudix-type nucleoside diphosphatase (YffH/AdpP family) [Rhizobium paknamense]